MSAIGRNEKRTRREVPTRAGVGVGARVCGPGDSFNRVAIWGCGGHRAPSVPTHPLIPSLEREGRFQRHELQITTRRTVGF